MNDLDQLIAQTFHPAQEQQVATKEPNALVPTNQSEGDTSKRKTKKRPPPPLRDDERDTRAELILMRRLCGIRMADIQKEFNISRPTAYRQLRKARESGYLDSAKDQLVGLLPKAIAVLDIHLEQNLDKEVAMKVLEGLGLLNKNVKVEQISGTTGTETFEMFRSRLTRTIHTDQEVNHNGPTEAVDTVEPYIDAVATEVSIEGDGEGNHS